MYNIKEFTTSVITDEPCHLPIDAVLLRKCMTRSVAPQGYIAQMYKRTTENTLTMNFKRDKKYKKYDRAWCNASPVSLHSPVRAGLFGNLTVIDQSTAQPRAMVSALLADKNELAPRESFAALFHYVEHKSTERQRVADLYYDGDLRQAKALYQKITFGGSNPHPKDKQLRDYCNNLRAFANMVCVANPKMMAKVTKIKEKAEHPTADVSMCTLALYGRNVEQQITEATISYLIDSNIIKDREFASMHDGVMFVNSSKKDTQTIITEVNAHIKNTMGFDVQYEHEDYTEAQTAFFDSLDNVTYECEEQYKTKFCRDYFATLSNHAEQKAYWELHFCFCIDQCKTGQLLTRDVLLSDGTHETERSLRWFSDKDLLSAYGNLDHVTEVNSFTGKPEKFVKVWLSLSDRRQYNYVDVKPYAGEYIAGKGCTPDTYNAFVGYPSYIWGDTTEYSEPEMAKLLNPFFTMCMHLVGCKGYDSRGRFPSFEQLAEVDKSKFDTLMYLIGHRIMHPSADKKPYAVLIQSIQGTGKNTLCDVIARIVGVSHYKCSSKIDDFCGDHAEGFLGKLFCIMNEAEISKTGKHKNAIKELISEEKSTCNAKYQRPFEYAVLAMIIVLSNESCPINLDTSGKDRRWMVFEANDFCARRWGESVWKAMHKHFKSHEFLRALKQFFMKLDYENYNYKTAKRINNKTAAYKKVAYYFYPSELLFIQDYIETGKYNTFTTPTPFYDTFDKQICVNARDFFEYAQSYYKDTNNESASAKSYKSFNSVISKFNMPIEKVSSKTSAKCAQWQFNPKHLYSWLITNDYIDEDTLDDCVKNALAGVTIPEDMVELDIDELGFDI